MRIQLSALTCATMLGLAACGSTQTGTRTSELAAVKPPPPAVQTYYACTYGTQSAATCNDINQGSSPAKWVCPVVLSKGSTGIPSISPYTLRAKNGANVVVVWSVNGDANARFQTGDGPTWIDATEADLAAVTDFGPVADSNGQGTISTQAQPYFRIRLATVPSPGTQDLKYNIKYHDGNGNEVVCDPFINNSGG